jgi:hypothetical protein
VALFFESPLKSCLAALSIYSLLSLAHGSPWKASAYPYFNYLAEAFLHGQLHLRAVPINHLDLSSANGVYYLYWPPMPAVLLMPIVALFGINASDILFTLVISAINVMLVSVLLRSACVRRVAKLSKEQRGILVLFFSLGTVHLTLAPFGQVWFTSQTIAFLFICLAYISAIKLDGSSAFFASGLMIACALLTRNHLLFAGVWPLFHLTMRNRSRPLFQRTLSIVSFGLPIALAIALTATYNWLRFQNPLDNGLSTHLMDPFFIREYQKYGAFDLHYVPRNFFYQYLAYPFPFREKSLMGGSLLLLSPVFFGAFSSPRKKNASWWVLWATIVVIAVPILLLMGPGWVQFGPRYTLDFTAPLLLLTAIGIRRWRIQTTAKLTMLSIVQYALGMLLLIRNL